MTRPHTKEDGKHGMIFYVLVTCKSTNFDLPHGNKKYMDKESINECDHTKNKIQSNELKGQTSL